MGTNQIPGQYTPPPPLPPKGNKIKTDGGRKKTRKGGKKHLKKTRRGKKVNGRK